ncbi:hypothetical protein N499_1072B, partial [Wolbachia pipientis wVitA]
GIQLFGF